MSPAWSVADSVPELGGVAGQALHLVGGEDDRLAATNRSSFHGPEGRGRQGPTTVSSSRSAGTKMKRAVWYFAATLPTRVRHTLPAGMVHFQQELR